MVNTQFAVAVHVVTVLAYGGDEPVKTEMLAQSVRTNRVVVSRVLARLAAAGLVISKRGRGTTGGVKLARAPQKITLADVFRAAVTSPMVRCRKKSNGVKCPVAQAIPQFVEKMTLDMEQTSLKLLAKWSLADVVKVLGKV